MTKAPDAFRTISEVAAELDLPQHVLRFWESRFPQIKPMKRGGGRRYYRPDDVELLRGIRHLLYGQGYTIRGVQRILREQGPRFVQSVWQDGAPQPEPAAEPAGESEVEGAGGVAATAEPSVAASAETSAAPAPVAEVPPFAEPLRHEPTFAPVAPSESLAAAEHPLQSEAEADADADLGAGDDHDRPSVPAPEPAPGLSHADRERLATALQDLAECRQLLDDALADVEQDA